MRTVTTGNPDVTQSPRGFLRELTPIVSEADKRRSGMALRLTLELSGVNQKSAARALGVEPSTINRRIKGEMEAPEVKAFREYLRKLLASGMFPVAVLADIGAEMWQAAMHDWSTEELKRRKRDLHRDEQRAQHRVDLWQMDDLDGVAPDSEDEVDAALMEHATRLVELYAVRQELRLRRTS